MDATGLALQPVLVLLAGGVLAVVACRSLGLPPIIGYLVAGVTLGPHALGLVGDTEAVRHLAEFGVVFLMFSIGLEFSLPRLRAMGRSVFGLGLAQVAASIALCVAAALAAGGTWQAGIALGGALAMSSTAIVSKLLAERLELDTPHGRDVIGVLLFQDLAVVPLLILVPALGAPVEVIGRDIAVALAKAAVVLAILTLAGPRLMRAWLGIIARRRSTELFVLNVLLITLLLSFVTGIAGLSLALGAFLAGMLIAETQYRYQVEEDIKPFRDVLLGLFFVSVGMMLDLAQVLAHGWLVVLFVTLLIAVKGTVIALLARVFGAAAGTALRTALALAQGGEFGFVLLAQARSAELAPEPVLQALFAAVILSMLATPFLVAASDRIVLRFAASEWMTRSLELHRVAVRTLESERHVIILGYGRNGQRLARLLEAEGQRYVALDLDPERVREAALAGDTVVYADCTRRESLVAAGLARAAAVVVTFADVAAAVRVLAHVHALQPAVPVIVRARDEADIAPLTAAGASEVVPEAFESGLMLASHALVWVGVPLARVMRRVSQVREEQYGLLRGLYYGASDAPDTGETAQPRLHAVTLHAHAAALARALDLEGLEALGVQVRAVRRPGQSKKLSAEEAGALREGDVIVLLGPPAALALAELRLLQG
ncbi:MAG: monovalent cation:proton antiporter-2 (CPA2) family protein [Betaproteobacteria bacterium]|nr:monovalent cation:proton antiporter-2 (CPA2) family protein [Betaproteobacteria bacterium]MDH5219862.1 monovalent cation:proton antiporter-2 (CPA2) family protein [Betaproteobacteria bacterium]MDH5349314.1 monovalent cation:proton antiporter-2 (CPA2) family protein [Betaproteobacteria bacterium]